MSISSLAVYFIIVQVFSGFDTGFLTVLSKRNKVLANCLSLISIVFILCLSTTTVILPERNIASYIFTSGYFITIILLFKFRYSKYNLKNFYDDLLRIDTQWKTGVSDFKFGVLIGLHTFVMTVSRYMVTITYSLVFRSNYEVASLKILFQVITCLATDMVPVINTVIFHSAYKRLNALKIGLKSFRFDVKTGQDVFNDIADCLEKIRAEHDKMIFLAFIVDGVSLTSVIYTHLYYIFDSTDWVIHVIGGIYPMYHLIQIFLPAVCAEMIAVQVDEMKLMLHDRLIFEQDIDEQKQLLHFLGLLEGRQLLRKAGRLVPVDLRRSIIILNFGVTYLIVLLQFSHLV